MIQIADVTMHDAIALGAALAIRGGEESWRFAKILMDMAEGAMRAGYRLECRECLEVAARLSGHNEDNRKAVAWEARKHGLTLCDCGNVLPVVQAQNGHCLACS